MAATPPDDSQRPPGSQPLIFVSDASAEAERLSNGLRRRGYAVVDVALGLLVGRVAVQQPALLVCDADAEGSLVALARLRDLPNCSAVDVLLIGARGGVLDVRADEVAREASGTFYRPVDLYALLKKTDALIGSPSGGYLDVPVVPAARSNVLLTPSQPPAPQPLPLLQPQVPSIPPMEPSSRAPRRSDSDAPVSVMPLPFDGEADSSPRSVSGPSELSSELAALLQEAEDRVEQLQAPGSQPPLDAPYEEFPFHAPLPADVLSALDEELDDESPDSSDSLPPDDGISSSTGTPASSTPPPPEFETSAGIRAPMEPSGAALTSAGRDGGTGLTEGGTDTPFSRSGSTAAELTSAEVQLDSAAPRREAVTPKPPRPASELPPATEAFASQDPSTNPPKPRPRQRVPPLPPADPEIRHAAPTAAETDPAARRAWQLDSIVQPDALATTPPPARDRRQSVRNDASLPQRLDSSGRDLLGAVPLTLPEPLGKGDALRSLALAIRHRFSGCIAFEVDEGIRRVILRDGDFVTAASGVHAESLVAVLVSRGDVPQEVLRQSHRLPPSGRHAGAALIAQGHLTQDQLWTVLRTHAEWIVGQVVGIDSGNARVEAELSGRLQEEPAVFGGSTGAEVLVEIVRRVIEPERALQRLSGLRTVLREGPQLPLLSECALTAEETDWVHQSIGDTVEAAIRRQVDPSGGAMLYALTELGILSIGPTRLEKRDRLTEGSLGDALDDEAIRERILARKALVEEGDYFAVLGVNHRATSYEIKRAYVELRRELDPARSLTARTADLRDTVVEIIDVLEEAYDILRDNARRERYRRAIEAMP